MSHVPYFVTDYTQQLFITHDVHQRRKNTDTAISTCKRIHINHIVYLEIQRNAFHFIQAFGQLFQTDCVWIIIGTYLIVLVHPVNIFFYIFSHLLIGQRNCLCSFHSATYGFFQIELCHCRYRAGHTQQYNCQFHQSLFHFHVSC